MKKTILILIVLFLIYTAVVCCCPFVTQADQYIIRSVQAFLKDVPLSIPVLAGGKLFYMLNFIAILIGGIFFFREKRFKEFFLFITAPYLAYFFNSLVKIIIQRPRPPFELQIAVHKTSFSYPSNHAFISCFFWGLIIFCLNKYCQNKILKICGITFSVFWILFQGFCRVWIGVHNPSDILAGYFLAGIMLFICIKSFVNNLPENKS